HHTNIQPEVRMSPTHRPWVPTAVSRAGHAIGICMLSTLLSWTPPLTAQTPVRVPPGEATLQECSAAAEAGDQAAANDAARRADSVANAFGADRQSEALVLRAQIISRCRIP